MAGPYRSVDDEDEDWRLSYYAQSRRQYPAAEAAPSHHHLDSQQVQEQEDIQESSDERAPFYTQSNSSYYNNNNIDNLNNRNPSESSLPLYRSRSQSLSMAQQKPPRIPQGAALTSTSIRAVDYTQTNTAAAPSASLSSSASPSPSPSRSPSIIPPLPPAARPQPSRNNNTSTSAQDVGNASTTTAWSSNSGTLTNSTSTNGNHQVVNPIRQQQTHAHFQQDNCNNSKKRIDWADEVARVFDGNTRTSKNLQDEKIEMSRSASPLPPSSTKPSMSRASTENDMDDENGYDDYDWDDDDELVKQLDQKYEEEYEKANAQAIDGRRRRDTVIRRFSPVHLGKLLLFTFLGNVVLILLLITPALVVQFLVKGRTDDSHLQFVCDNIEAWCYWIAFNFIAKWIIHSLFDLIPKLFVFIVELIWGDLNEKFIGYVELFDASAAYIKPLFFAGFFWGSFAITFNSIFHLRNPDDPENSRAPYTYRIYQVVELLFFIALVWSIEKILIRIISLNFHAVAYADRIRNNSFALATIDRLKNYRPKKRIPRSGYNTPSAFSRVGFGGVSSSTDGSYFSSPHLGRSRANTPPFPAGGSPVPTPANSMGVRSPTLPGAPEPTHQSLWSRLPIPSTFRHSQGHHQNLPSIDDNAIPLQVTAQQSNNNRDGRDITDNTANGTSRLRNASFAPDSVANAGSVPTTPGTPNPADTLSSSNDKKKSGKKIHMFGKKAATAQEIARQAMVDPLKTLNNPDVVGKGLGLDFGGAKDAKKLARDLFHAFRSDNSRNYLITSDFYPAFKTETEAEAAFAVFDKDGNGDLSRPEIRATILTAYKERKFLARSLQDVSEAVSTLDRLFQVAACIILALIAFAIFKVDIYSNLTTAYTIAIAASFIFKSAAQNVFDSVIFLFATHPFDSGDRIFLLSEVYVVKRLGLFSTLFTRWDGTETMIANSQLGTMTITNLRRSPPQFENATLQVGWSTSLDQLDQLEKKMNNWLQKDEKRMFAPSTAVVLQNFNYMRYIEITVGMLHRENWQDWGERWNRRTAFHSALLHYCKELGITFVNSAQPIQYWQEDLERPPVEDDDDDQDDMRSPLSPIDGENQIPIPIPLQPLMGFLPPEGSTMRRRKGYSKSRNMAGVGA